MWAHKSGSVRGSGEQSPAPTRPDSRSRRDRTPALRLTCPTCWQAQFSPGGAKACSPWRQPENQKSLIGTAAERRKQTAWLLAVSPLRGSSNHTNQIPRARARGSTLPPLCGYLQAGCVPTHQRATSLRSFALGFAAWDHCPERMQDVSDGTMVPSYGKRLVTIVNGVCRTGWCVRTLPARLQRCQGRPDPGAQRRSSGMLSSRPKRNCRSVVARAP
jgi:hypothetical protein